MRLRSTELSTAWRKSSYSGNGGNCVEVGDGLAHAIPVRDSKDPNGPALVFKPAAWTSFISAIRSNELPTV
jgi:hypothetical protein